MNNKYETESRERWGDTEVFGEFRRKTSEYSEKKWKSIALGMDAIFAEFGSLMKNGEVPSCDEAKLLVKKLQNYITDNFYTCTDDMLSGLGLMYVADERFTKSIDKHGEGTADFVFSAIASCC